MKTLWTKILITSAIFSLIGTAYLSFDYDNMSNLPAGVAYGSDLSSTSGDGNPLSLNDKVNADISFLNTLDSLKQIKIDTSIFEDTLFGRLIDNSVPIDPIPAGRDNPFAPIEIKEVGKITSGLPAIKTNDASQITNNSAVLNGLVNTVTGVKNIYFEYGLTSEMGSKTAILKPSLVGSFSKVISGLTPKTMYYYQAVAEINGVKSFGEMFSFTTAQ